MHRHPSNPWKGFLLGAISGMAGVIAMGWYWQAVKSTTGRDPRQDYTDADVPDTDALDNVSVVGTQHKPGESSTAALGRIAYTAITGSEPQTEELKTTLSYAVHYGISMFMGGLYGALRERSVTLDVQGGVALGTGLWLLGDETLMPVLGLTDGPTAYPPDVHAHGFAAHQVYGVVTALVMQSLYRLV